VLARIAVVGLDDVAEDERGPAVGVVQLEHRDQPLMALAGVVQIELAPKDSNHAQIYDFEVDPRMR